MQRQRTICSGRLAVRIARQARLLKRLGFPAVNPVIFGHQPLRRQQPQRQVSRQRGDLSTAMLAVLAAINMADEVMELRGEKETYTKMDRARHLQQPPQQQTPAARSNLSSFKEAKKG